MLSAAASLLSRSRTFTVSSSSCLSAMGRVGSEAATMSAIALGPSTFSSTPTSSSGSAGDSEITVANSEVTLRTSASSSTSSPGACSSMGSIRAFR